MKQLQRIVAATALVLFSAVSNAGVIFEGTASVGGFVAYGENATPDSAFDGITGLNWAGSMQFGYQVTTGALPAVSQDANWYLSGEGRYGYGFQDISQNRGSGGDSGSFSDIYLGYGSVTDVFNVSGYGDFIAAYSALPTIATLTDVINGVDGLLTGTPIANLFGALLPFADSIYFAEGARPGEVVFASTLPLAIRGFDEIVFASAKFGGSLTLRAETAPVPVPATLSLFALGLAGLGFARRKRLAA